VVEAAAKYGDDVTWWGPTASNSTHDWMTQDDLSTLGELYAYLADQDRYKRLCVLIKSDDVFKKFPKVPSDRKTLAMRMFNVVGVFRLLALRKIKPFNDRRVRWIDPLDFDPQVLPEAAAWLIPHLEWYAPSDDHSREAEVSDPTRRAWFEQAATRWDADKSLQNVLNEWIVANDKAKTHRETVATVVGLMEFFDDWFDVRLT
jgi:hypothetical protein